MSLTSRLYSPAQLISELGISSPKDIDIEAIAYYCGATIQYKPLQGCEACIIGHGSRALITINSISPRPRQRFSGGHELGHWMRDRGSILLSCTENMVGQWSENNPERTANRFAADLLLPLEMFSPYAQNKPINFTTVEQIGNVFDTSLTATAIRLVEHGSFPSMIVCSDIRGRKWFLRSPIVPDRLWPHEMPGRETDAFALSRDPNATPQGPQTLSAAQWIDHESAGRYRIMEDSIRIRPGLVLTLLWWQDEQQILDFDDDVSGNEEDDFPY